MLKTKKNIGLVSIKIALDYNIIAAKLFPYWQNEALHKTTPCC